MNKKMHTLCAADEERVLRGRAAMAREYQSADAPAAVAKGLAAYATKLRNHGRAAAIKNHPFTNVYEQTQNSLAFAHKHLHELEPELGYLGTVMWSCPACNNSALFPAKRPKSAYYKADLYRLSAYRQAKESYRPEYPFVFIGHPALFGLLRLTSLPEPALDTAARLGLARGFGSCISCNCRADVP